MTRSALASAFALLMGLSSLAPVGAGEVPRPAIERVAGADRYATAAALAALRGPAATLVVARGDAFPDALAGSYLAGSLSAALVLTRPDGVPQVTLDAFAAAGARNAVLLGGTDALGAEVGDQLRAAGLSVERIAGSGRVETAAPSSRPWAKCAKSTGGARRCLRGPTISPTRRSRGGSLAAVTCRCC